MNFEAMGLCPPLVSTLAKLGYPSATPIQEKALPAILAGRDLMAAAQTGTGKTAAFALPLLHQLAEQPIPADSARLRVVILVPTRELATQVMHSFQRYGAELPFTPYALYGGVPMGPQKKQLAAGVDILVATPGRLRDLFSQGAVRFSALKTLVLDEADRMLDLGFADDLNILFQAFPKQRQTLLFSATFSQTVRDLAHLRLSKPLTVETTPRNSAAKSVKQWVVPVDKKRKAELLLFMWRDRQWQQVLVFAKTKVQCDALAAFLSQRGVRADSIHGDRPQASRQQALDAFKQGLTDVLVATDVAARGLDISGLGQVVNFDLPLQAEDYIHRIGRTGRAGAAGEAISLVAADEISLLNAIETLLGKTLSRDEEPGFEPKHHLPASVTRPAHPSRGQASKTGGRKTPSHWHGFDSPGKSAHAPSRKPPGKRPSPRQGKEKIHQT